MPAWFLELITAICYAASKGWWTAWFELQERGIHAWEEKPNATDDARADKFRAAVRDAGVQPRPSDPKPEGATPPGEANASNDPRPNGQG